MEEAVAWIGRSPFGDGAELEIRPLFEMADFGAQITPELQQQQESLRRQLQP